jgi:hypothetical protein
LKPVLKYARILALLNILFILGGYIITSLVSTNLHVIDIAILSIVFSTISLVTLIIFFLGQTKAPDSQTLHSLAAVSLKFLLEIAFALIWFIIVKKTFLASVLVFFVLYLTLSLFSLLVIMKILKNRPL